jgi:hypothetical protein
MHRIAVRRKRRASVAIWKTLEWHKSCDLADLALLWHSSSDFAVSIVRCLFNVLFSFFCGVVMFDPYSVNVHGAM